MRLNRQGGRGSLFYTGRRFHNAGGGSAPPDWRASLPEAIRSAPALADVKDVSALAQAFVDTKALVGASIRPPGPDAAPEARKEFVQKLREKVPELVLIPTDEKDPAHAEALEGVWSRLGKPKDAKAYALDAAELPAGVELNQDELRTLAGELGLTVAQFKKLAKATATGRAAALEAQKAERQALKTELGAAFDERLGAAAATAKQLGLPEDVVAAIKKGEAPAQLARAMIAAAKAIGGEGNEAGTQGRGDSGRLTPAEAEAQIAELLARPEYFNSRINPALTASLQKRMLELQAMTITK